LQDDARALSDPVENPLSEAPRPDHALEPRVAEQLILQARATESVVGQLNAPGSKETPRPSQDEEPDVARLEEHLRSRATELRALRARAVRAEGVVRDLMAQLESAARLEPARPPSNPDDQALRDARARALEAEVARAEAQLRCDEALGHLVELQAREQARQAPGHDEAAAAGRERGLHALLAEAEELRDVALARVTLLDHDLTFAQAARAESTRELAEMREQLELAMAQARGLAERFEHGLDNAGADAVFAELTGARLRIAELDAALPVLGQLVAAARADGQEQRRTLGAVRAELSARQTDHRHALSSFEHVERELARERERVRELAGELARKSAENMTLRDELAKAQASSASVRDSVRVLESNVANAEGALGETRERADAALRRSSALHRSLRDARAALIAVQESLRSLRETESVLRDPHGETEPGMPLSFDDISE
jgi:chromosome segregation ATPase